MSLPYTKILIIGATSGLGRLLAETLHALPSAPHIIATGRRSTHLASLTTALSTRISTYTWDITSLDTLSSTAQEILASHPDIDTVILNAGIASSPSFTAPSSSSSELDAIRHEISTNLTAPVLLSSVFVPHLLALSARTGKRTTLLLTGSGLGFTPVPSAAVYCATKAGLHSFCVSLRQQVAGAGVGGCRVVEIVPPFLDTGFMGGKKKEEEEGEKPRVSGPVPMRTEEFVEGIMRQLVEGEEEIGRGGRGKLEVSGGTATPRVGAWRASIGGILEKMGMRE